MRTRHFLLCLLLMSLPATGVFGAPAPKKRPAKPHSQPAAPAPAPKPLIESPPPPHETPVDSHQWELRTAPIAFIARWITLEALYRVNSQWAIGPSAVIFASAPVGNIFFPSYRGKALGLVATYFFQPPEKRGWYGTARYHYENFTSYPHASSSEFHYKGHALMFVGGYRLPFLRNFFVLGGAGMQLGRYEKVEAKTAAITRVVTVTTNPNHFRVVPYLEAKVGAEF